MLMERTDAVSPLTTPNAPEARESRRAAASQPKSDAPQDAVDFSPVRDRGTGGSGGADASPGAGRGSDPDGGVTIGSSDNVSSGGPSVGGTSVGGTPVGGTSPIGTPVGGTVAPTPLPGLVETTAPATSPLLVSDRQAAQRVRREVARELRALRIAIRRELKQQYGDRLLSDPALKSKLRELVRGFQNDVRDAFSAASGGGAVSERFDGQALIDGLSSAYGAFSSALSTTFGVSLNTSFDPAGAVASGSGRTLSSNAAGSSASTASLADRAVAGASDLPFPVVDARLLSVSQLFQARVARIEHYLTNQSATVVVMRQQASAFSSLAAPSGLALDVAV